MEDGYMENGSIENGFVDDVEARKNAVKRWQYLCLETGNTERIRQYDEIAIDYDKVKIYF